jgi:hypothetical protein
MCHRPGCVNAVVSSSSCPLPLPIVPGPPVPYFHPANSCSRRRLGVLVLVLPSSSWSSHSWGCWVVARRSVVVSLPLLLLLVCPFPPLATLLPVSTPRALAHSGGWPSSSYHDPPRKQWRAAAVGVVVSPAHSRRAPRFHPASRRSQRWCGRRGCHLVFRQLGSCNVAGKFLHCGYPTSLGTLTPPM